MSHTKLLALGLAVLIAADLVLAANDHWSVVLTGVALWGIHMGITQGLLATMVADSAPIDLRGTAYGFFNLVSGLAILLASVLAGIFWDRLGASFTFYAGAVFCVVALFGLAWQPIRRIVNTEVTARAHLLPYHGPSGFGLQVSGLPSAFITDLPAQLWSGGTYTLAGAHPLANNNQFLSRPLGFPRLWIYPGATGIIFYKYYGFQL